MHLYVKSAPCPQPATCLCGQNNGVGTRVFYYSVGKQQILHLLFCGSLMGNNAACFFFCATGICILNDDASQQGAEFCNRPRCLRMVFQQYPVLLVFNRVKASGSKEGARMISRNTVSISCASSCVTGRFVTAIPPKALIGSACKAFSRQ